MARRMVQVSAPDLRVGDFLPGQGEVTRVWFRGDTLQGGFTLDNGDNHSFTNLDEFTVEED